MKELVIGILAHVDAGKTTLSEAMLYAGGSIQKMGRVDTKNAFLDTYALERDRGVTIFSKQAIIESDNFKITLLDTPGHIDFSTEMERTLSVLDYAVLVISGADGVQGHTLTLWNLLRKYKIPFFIFINKMDMAGTNQKALLKELKEQLSGKCVDFTCAVDLEKSFYEESFYEESFYEEIAMCDEAILERYLEEEVIEIDDIRSLITKRKVIPCFFGSALKLEGVKEFMQGLKQYTESVKYGTEFAAEVFKIARDEQGNRLTFMKITGGSLKVRTLLTNMHPVNTSSKDVRLKSGQEYEKQDIWEEKVNEIRIYSGEKYDVVSEAEAGTVCAVTGLTKVKSGEGLGVETGKVVPFLEPVLTYHLALPEGVDAVTLLPKLRQLEEEDPMLRIGWNENEKEIYMQVMGELQTEILQSLIKERFEIEAEFKNASIVYKETILNTVEGVGHFEPLRHYAEVHLLLEPGEAGSGLLFELHCSEDMLAKNWQRLILSHLREKKHKGVLTGADITDMKISVAAGKAHPKHTEGGDFRQATYRALRQGLKQAESVLLEPYYEFRIEVPDKMLGKVIADIERMYGTFEIVQSEKEMSYLIGTAPVVTMREYQKEVSALTGGRGRLFSTVAGYMPCHNAQEVIEQIGYDSERDVDNPAGSVFCSHGAGFIVSWDAVKDYMHIESQLTDKKEVVNEIQDVSGQNISRREFIETEEVDRIFERTFYANKKDKDAYAKKMRKKNLQEQYALHEDKKSHAVNTYKNAGDLEEYFLIDGYNIIYAWEDLKDLSKSNMDAARNRLMDMLCRYQSIRGCHVIVVFDAYKVKEHDTEILDYHNIHVVYTREAETADQYIEKFAHENRKKYSITVATSDGMEQMIVRGKDCRILSARGLYEEMKQADARLWEMYEQVKDKGSTKLFDVLSDASKKQMDA